MILYLQKSYTLLFTTYVYYVVIWDYCEIVVISQDVFTMQIFMQVQFITSLGNIIYHAYK